MLASFGGFWWSQILKRCWNEKNIGASILWSGLTQVYREVWSGAGWLGGFWWRQRSVQVQASLHHSHSLPALDCSCHYHHHHRPDHHHCHQNILGWICLGDKELDWCNLKLICNFILKYWIWTTWHQNISHKAVIYFHKSWGLKLHQMNSMQVKILPIQTHFFLPWKTPSWNFARGKGHIQKGKMV